MRDNNEAIYSEDENKAHDNDDGIHTMLEEVVEGSFANYSKETAWKEFDKNHQWFAQEPRSIRLALATDGFNPYVDMLNQLHRDDVEPITIGANVIELEAQIEYKVEVDYDEKDSDQEDDTMILNIDFDGEYLVGQFNSEMEGGHEFKPWKQSPVEMQDEAVYIDPCAWPAEIKARYVDIDTLETCLLKVTVTASLGMFLAPRYFFIIALLYLNLEDEVLIEEGGLQTNTLSGVRSAYALPFPDPTYGIALVAGGPGETWQGLLASLHLQHRDAVGSAGLSHELCVFYDGKSGSRDSIKMKANAESKVFFCILVLAKMDVIKSQQISSKPIEKVIVHPLVLLSIVDHYNRVARDTRKYVVGVFLGTSFKGTVDVTDSYAVPFEEDNRDPILVIIDVQPEELGIPTKIALMMLVIYLSLLIRSVIALNNLINNKMLNKEHKNSEDLKPLVVPTTAGS
ncbi:26S proteasome non-ATPase regulatory subunit 7 -like protein B [Capsicum annuum]|nr:26S proteasome non-ATPase regulatory subunit 7 -like protein B [Capsicum annuum]